MALVTRIIGDCPSCGAKNAFGNISVKSEFVVRGCIACRHKKKLLLPPIRKKVLYLDQFFFSRAFRRSSKYDAKYANAIDWIRQLALNQQLVAPFSTVHEDETHQWSGDDHHTPEDLMRFIKNSSGGHKFEASWCIQKDQTVGSFMSFLKEQSAEFGVDSDIAFRNSVHGWTDYFWIDVGGYIGDVDRIAKAKNDSVADLVAELPRWRESKMPFEESLELEYRDAGRGYIDAYSEFVMRTGSGDVSALFDAPIASMVIESMMHGFDHEVSNDVKLKKVLEFFNSGHFRKIPYQYISCRAFAVLKERVKRGAYQNPKTAEQKLSGIFSDIDHVATFAPYCDAIFIDKAMEEIVRDKRVGLSRTFGVQVFSESNWEEFEAWLHQVQSSISEAHRSALAVAYPESIADPVKVLRRIANPDN